LADEGEKQQCGERAHALWVFHFWIPSTSVVFRN
jgi:hypothetical protein